MQEEDPWCMLFSNDIVCVGENGLEDQNILEKWRCWLESVGLKISKSADLKHNICSLILAVSPILHPLLSTEHFCQDFRYLGFVIQSNGELDHKVRHRIDAGWMQMATVHGHHV
ncbi:uncharacterized protein LOC101742934 [Bombyx mori]|uniref:Uncharacterized protein n=1 Tax=Bombyx mori TaxID=7091 RepID=A0A8R2AIG8_BOMMO|nr:uncharacterized protein LOC101742934 [Bombyx mori]